MKLMIIGHGRHGKDTVAEILARRFGLKFTSSSWFCAERLMMSAFKKEAGNSFSDKWAYTTVEKCFADRHNHRKFWFDTISAYCGSDLARLTRDILAENDIYVGIRNRREFLQARCEALFDYAIWVEAFDRTKYAEPAESNDLAPWMADFVLDNNGTIAELEDRTVKLYEMLKMSYDLVRQALAQLQPITSEEVGQALKRRLESLATAPQMRRLLPGERPVGGRPAALENLTRRMGDL